MIVVVFFYTNQKHGFFAMLLSCFLKYLKCMKNPDADRVGDDGKEEGGGDDFRCQFVVAAHFSRVNKAVNGAGGCPKDVGDAQLYGTQSYDHAQGDEDEGR